MSDDRPIVALATASGRGAVGILRASGRDLSPLRTQLFGAEVQPPRVALYRPFTDAGGEIIDRGLAIWFPAPESYTGEDVLELQAHGGPVVLQMLLERLLVAGQGIGLRLARPGEFTERAFLNGKLDLAQAEAVADLIDAQSTQAARLASRSLAGEFSRHIDGLLTALTRLRMLVEATLDFPEEEVDVLERADATGQLQIVIQRVNEVLEQAIVGARLREGFTVVIAGEPNVGKSSLLNKLAGDEIAIVTPVAGTTRDRIRESITIEGIPINLIDTAGLRVTDDVVERIGVDIARREMARADLVLFIAVATRIDHDKLDPSADQTRDEAFAIAGDAGIPVLEVRNKIDLIDASCGVDADGRVGVSALTGQGIDELRHQLLERMGWTAGSEAQFMARERHLEALRRAAAHLSAAESALGVGLEFFAEELRLAQTALGEVTGAFSADDLLGKIFQSFCIGK